MRKKHAGFYISIIALLCAGLPRNAFAIQAHGGAEGVVVHQFGHVFFLVSMTVFAYWLGKGRILKYPGWRFILWFAIVFCLWNLDVILMHYLDEQGWIVTIVRTGPWAAKLDNPWNSRAISLLYYLGKLDHLICVPAMFLLYSGLRQIRKSLADPEKTGGESP
jgi:hypothetical protein